MPDALIAIAMSLVLAAAGCAAPESCPPATPQRPSFSFSTATTAAGTYELETGMLLDPNDEFTTPTTLKYGYDDRTELFVQTTPIVHVSDGDHTGFGDVGLGTRWRFLDATDEHPSFAVQGLVKVPTANEHLGLGTGEPDLTLAAMMTAPFSDGAALTTYYQLDMLGDRDGGSGVDVGNSLAVCYGWPLNDRVGAFTEVTARRTPEQDVSQRFVTAGFTYAVAPSWIWDCAYIRSIGGDNLGPQFALGFTRNLGKPRRRRRSDSGRRSRDHRTCGRVRGRRTGGES